MSLSSLGWSRGSLLMFWGICGFCFVASTVFSDSIASISFLPPRFSSISPDSFLVHWDPYALADHTTHYQVRVNGFLYGVSTQGTSKYVSSMIPGNIVKVDYVVYHRGKILAISSPSTVLMCPATPRGLYADNITSTTFRLNWLYVPTAIEYLLYTNGVLNKTVEAPYTYTVLGGFTPGSKVEAKMLARNASGLSYWSDAIFVQLLPPPPSLTVSLNSITQTNFRISWNLIENVSTYTVFKNGNLYASGGATFNTCLVTDCVPGTYTTVRVRAENNSGFSELSNELAVLTIPATPRKPVASNIGTNSFYLEWAPVPYAQGYKVYRDKFWLLYNVPAPNTGVFCQRGFDPGTIATMSITAYNSTGESPFSEEEIVQLKPLSSGTPLLENFNNSYIATNGFCSGFANCVRDSLEKAGVCFDGASWLVLVIKLSEFSYEMLNFIRQLSDYSNSKLKVAVLLVVSDSTKFYKDILMKEEKFQIHFVLESVLSKYLANTEILLPNLFVYDEHGNFRGGISELNSIQEIFESIQRKLPQCFEGTNVENTLIKRMREKFDHFHDHNKLLK